MKAMNNSSKRILVFLLLSVMIFVLWGNAVYYAQYIREHYSSVGIRIKGTGVSKRVLEQAVKKEAQKENQKLLQVSAWNRLEDQKLENEALYTSITVQLIEVYGAMDQVYPAELAGGSIPGADDYEGCLIDRHTAYELFHTVDAVGNLLTYQGRQYCVRGILRSSEPVCLVEQYEDGTVYSNLELRFTEEDNGGPLSGDFIRQYDLADRYTVIDGSLLAKLLELSYRLPAWLLGFCLLYELLRVLWKRRTLPGQVLALLLLLVTLWPLLSWLMEFEFYIPRPLIPTKWSDFSFWSRKVAALSEWRKEISNLAPSEKDILLQQYTASCIFCIGLAMLGMTVFIAHGKIFFAGTGRTGGVLLIALAECVAAAALFQTGRVFALPRGYLGMPVFYLIARDAFCWFRDYFTRLNSRTE